MSLKTSRRAFLKSLAAGAIVLGFDTATRSWVTTAEAAPSMIVVPGLDGVLYVDDATRTAAADDFGHIISRKPVAVLKPGSVSDIAKVIRFARSNTIKVAGRGQGHSTYGQPQVDAGIVIDMSSLNTIRRIRDDYAEVEAGVRWIDLLQQTLPEGLTPPVLTDYIELSVGGTLTVGGIGGASHQYGVQVDNVLELQVVTGEGVITTCSANRRPELFYSALAGLGQCAIITRAKVRLIPAKTQARVFMLYYTDFTLFTNDQKQVIGDERFNYVEGQVVINPTGGWMYMLEAASFYTPPALPNNAQLLAGLGYDPATAVIADTSYFEFLNRLAATIAILKDLGVWSLPHPWYDVFVPASKVVEYVGGILQTLTLDDTGQGPVLIYPVKTSRFHAPFFRTPNEPVAFLFDILRTAPTKDVALEMVQENRQLFEEVRDLGGNRYAIGAIPFSHEDWRQHFGPVWPLLVVAKHRYDPDNVLTPGQGIFG